jgi:hypothetical protein
MFNWFKDIYNWFKDIYLAYVCLRKLDRLHDLNGSISLKEYFLYQGNWKMLNDLLDERLRVCELVKK